MEQLSTMPNPTNHQGSRHFLDLQNHFELEGPSGQHQCLVQDLLVGNYNNVPRSLGFRVPTKAMAKDIIEKVLLCLDYLHTKANLIYADVFVKT